MEGEWASLCDAVAADRARAMLRADGAAERASEMLNVDLPAVHVLQRHHVMTALGATPGSMLHSLDIGRQQPVTFWVHSATVGLGDRCVYTVRAAHRAEHSTHLQQHTARVNTTSLFVLWGECMFAWITS
jgi:hypothetical protein